LLLPLRVRYVGWILHWLIMDLLRSVVGFTRCCCSPLFTHVVHALFDILLLVDCCTFIGFVHIAVGCWLVIVCPVPDLDLPTLLI